MGGQVSEAFTSADKGLLKSLLSLKGWIEGRCSRGYEKEWRVKMKGRKDERKGMENEDKRKREREKEEREK